MSTFQSPEYKKAAIDFVLAHGRCESMTTSTALALADLSVRGVDYGTSQMPNFRQAAIEPGDSFTDATWGEAFACTVYAIGHDPENWRDEYTFHVSDDDLKTLMVQTMILGVLAAAEAGDSLWRERADTREVERLLRHREAERLRAPAATDPNDN